MSVINPNPFTTRPEIEGTFGVVASTHWIATAVGMATLEKGGNAFDAAVATAFTFQVVEPHLNGPGGDVPVIVYDIARDKPEVICGQGPAPAGATIAHYRRYGLTRARHRAPCRLRTGHVRTWMLLLRDYGTPAARATCSRQRSDMRRTAIRWSSAPMPRSPPWRNFFSTHWPTSAAIYLPNDKVPPTGTLFTNQHAGGDLPAYPHRRQKAPAADRIAQIERARASWSKGSVAEAIDKFCRTQELMDTSGTRHRGVLAGSDMARWHAAGRSAAHLRLRPLHDLQNRPRGEGPVMLQQSALLKGFDLDRLDPTSADFIHLQVECAKLAYADREAFLWRSRLRQRADGDAAFRCLQRTNAASSSTDTASLELRPGSIEGFGSVLTLALPPTASRPDAPRRPGAGEPTVGRLGGTRGDTVHFDIVDQAGNMVSATPSGGWLQSSPVIAELGFCLGTRVNVLARRKSSGGAGARQAAAHHADADARAARRRALPCLGYARRRPAGPMDHAVFSAPCS